jgi:L-asparaginase / beta-aspartyl-peptidase
LSTERQTGDGPIPDVVLGLHGGISPRRRELTREDEQDVRAALTVALRRGAERLFAGGSPLDAVEQAIQSMEEAPLLNAGRGAVFTREGRNELDASIMEGTTKRAGAVAGVTTIRHPISAARAVMERSPHVLLIGPGAERFAQEQGLEQVDPSYFRTEFRWRELQSLLEAEARRDPAGRQGAEFVPESPQDHGTVGAVARNAAGQLAAGTSTGGMTGKVYGRLGDSPIIGAGTYADDAAAAISCTGHGEYFIRLSVAHEIVAQCKYGARSAAQAVEDVIQRQLTAAGGRGAAIVLDRDGNFVTSHNTEGLYRGWITREGTVTVRIFEW